MAGKLVERRAPSSGATLGELDGLRATAALAVLFFHVAWFGAAALAVVDDGRKVSQLVEEGAFPSVSVGAIYVMSLIGAAAVDCFFVLSGFGIALGFLRTMNTQKGKAFSLWRYWTKRFVGRVYPTLLVLLALGLVRDIWYNLCDNMMATSVLRGGSRMLTQHNFLYHMLFVDDFVMPDAGHLGWTWSLCVTARFYIIFPLLVKMCGGRRRWMYMGSLLLVAVPLAIRTCNTVTYMDNPELERVKMVPENAGQAQYFGVWWWFIYTGFSRRGHSLFMGVISAFWYTDFDVARHVADSLKLTMDSEGTDEDSFVSVGQHAGENVPKAPVRLVPSSQDHSQSAAQQLAQYETRLQEIGPLSWWLIRSSGRCRAVPVAERALEGQSAAVRNRVQGLADLLARRCGSLTADSGDPGCCSLAGMLLTVVTLVAFVGSLVGAQLNDVLYHVVFCFGGILVSAGYCSVILLSLMRIDGIGRLWSRVLGWSGWRPFSVLSYGIYMFHPLFLCRWYGRVRGEGVGWEDLLTGQGYADYGNLCLGMNAPWSVEQLLVANAACLGASMLLSAIVYRWLEMPVYRWVSSAVAVKSDAADNKSKQQ